VPIGARSAFLQKYRIHTGVIPEASSSDGRREVDVNVINCLSAIRTGIDHGAISLRQPLGSCNFRCGPVQVAKQLPVFLLRVRDGSDMQSRDNEDVHRRLWLQVRESVAVIILIDGSRGDCTVYDLAEDAAHGQSLQRSDTGIRKQSQLVAGHLRLEQSSVPDLVAVLSIPESDV